MYNARILRMAPSQYLGGESFVGVSVSRFNFIKTTGAAISPTRLDNLRCILDVVKLHVVYAQQISAGANSENMYTYVIRWVSFFRPPIRQEEWRLASLLFHIRIIS